MTDGAFDPHPYYREYPAAQMRGRARRCHENLRHRRTVRDFAAWPVPRGIIDTLNPMRFPNEMLRRLASEHPIPVPGPGYPAERTTAPDKRRKQLIRASTPTS